MAASSSRGGPFHGGATPFRSRDGLSTRPAATSDEIQLRIDPMSADFDDEITGLHSQVRQLRNVAQEIGTEAKFQKDFLDQLVCYKDCLIFVLQHMSLFHLVLQFLRSDT
ncbi:Bet1-like protein At4g14600 [Linum perenne]